MSTSRRIGEKPRRARADDDFTGIVLNPKVRITPSAMPPTAPAVPNPPRGSA